MNLRALLTQVYLVPQMALRYTLIRNRRFV